MKSHTTPPHTAHTTEATYEPIAPHQKPDTPEASPVITRDEDLRTLLEKNIKWSQVIYHQNRKIQHRLTWMTIGSYIRLFLILIPLIVGVFFISDFLSQNGEFVNGALQNWKTYFEIFQSSNK